MAAFKRAIADGADGIEFDLRITSDRQWVICHDASVLLDGRTVTIAKTTLNEIIDLRAKHGGDSDYVPCPPLSTFLEWTDGRVRLIYDVKDVGHEQELIDAIERHPMPDHMVISSFRRQVLAEIKRLRPDWKIAWIVGNPGTRFLQKTLFERVLKRARALSLNALHLHETWASNSVFAMCSDGELDLVFWTINEFNSMQRICESSATAVISDVAEMLVHHSRTETA